MCTPVIYPSGVGASLQTWASYVLLLPGWHTDPVFRINPLLTTNDTVRFRSEVN